jgi:hypothetical protein
MNNELSKSYVINNFRINPEIYDAVQEEEEKIRPVFDIIDTVRDFNQYKVVRSMQKTLKVGLAYDFQVLPQVPADELDVRLDVIVTDQQVIFI